MCLLNLYCQTRILVLNRVAYRLVPHFVLPILLTHHVVAILDRSLDVFLRGTQEIELHYGVILELALSDEVQLALGFGEDGKGGHEVVGVIKTIEVFEDEVRVLSELDEEILVGFDAFEFPVVAFKNEVKVHFGVTGEFYLDVFGKAVLVLDHYLHSQHLRLLEHLHCFRLLLDTYDERVLVIVDYQAAVAQCRVSHLRVWLHLKNV